MYLEKRHEEILGSNLEAGSYKRTVSLVVVHGFGVEITKHQVTSVCIYFINRLPFDFFFSYFTNKIYFFQAKMLRSSDEVYSVEKNEEI